MDKDNNTPKPFKGMRFFHKRIYDAVKMPLKIPQMYEISAIRMGCIYYRPVFRYEPTGRVEVGKCKDYCSLGYWPRVFLREATKEEADFGSFIN